MATVLITGGTGLIGTHLTKLLKTKGYRVLILSRSKNKNPDIYLWDIYKEYVDVKAIKQADYIIHLSGANIAEKRWTKKQKKELIESRVLSTNILLKKVKEHNPNLKAFISASGVGYYGAITSENIYTENDAPGNDFVSKICNLWEKSAFKFNNLNIRTVVLRTGVVLTKNGGALNKISKPIKMGVGAIIGKGNQYFPWIHINDLCEVYTYAIENTKLNGVYNAVAPEHITNKEITYEIAGVLSKKIWLPPIPSFVLKILFGKMAIILLKGSRISSEKIKNSGFKFEFPTLKLALKSIFN